MFLFSFSRYRDNENSFHEDMSRNSIFDVQTPPNSISLLNDTVSHTLHMYIMGAGRCFNLGGHILIPY